MRRSWLFLASAAVLLFSFSCQRRAANEPSGETLATVNGQPIAASELIDAAKLQMRFRGGDYSLMEKKLELLHYLIDNELLFQQALEEQVSRNPTIREHIIRLYLQQAIPSHYEPREQEIRDYYEKNRLELDRIQASHILIKFGQGRSEETALQEIRKMEKKAAAKGARFDELAAKYSEDEGSKRRRGDLGLFSRGRMVKPFEEAAFALKKVGDLSAPVKTEFGYHLIKLTGDQRGLERQRLRIKEQLLNNWRRERYQALIEKLRSRARIKCYENRVAALPLGEPPPAAPAAPKAK